LESWPGTQSKEVSGNIPEAESSGEKLMVLMHPGWCVKSRDENNGGNE
jgi:hypothetical protein